MKVDEHVVKMLNSYLLRFLTIEEGAFHDDIFRGIPYCLDQKQLTKVQKLIRATFINKKDEEEDDSVELGYNVNQGLSQSRRSRRKATRKKGRRKAFRGTTEKFGDIVSDIDRYTSSYFDFRKSYFDDTFELLYQHTNPFYKKVIKMIMEMLEKNIAKSTKRSLVRKNLEEVQTLFKLDDAELDILTFFFMYESYDYFRDLARSEGIKMDELYASVKLHSRFFSISPQKLRSYYDKNATLIKTGLISKSAHRGDVEISSFAAEFIAGASSMTLLDSFISKDKGDIELQIDDFIIKKKNIEIIRAMLTARGGSNILLYGEPGTGKTEFARTIIREIRKQGYFVNQYDANGEEDLKHRKGAIVASQNVLGSEENVIIIDESDPVIASNNQFWMCDNDGSKDSKAWINSVIENTKHKVIWISNSTESVDPSTKRRFSYSLEFKALSCKQREKVWDVQLSKKKIKYVSALEVKELANKYQINAGGIALALHDIGQMKSLRNSDQKKKMLNNILSQHEEFVFGKVSKLNILNKSYSLDAVNSDSDLQKLLDVLEKFYKMSEESGMESPIANFNILLQGNPGTGKTEFVKYAAEMLGKNLILKRLSDIRSKWYGESLQNIAAMFSQAQDQNAILFLDEADSFFMNREESSQYAGDETTELLTQMENFKGILFCSTNLVKSLDPAVMRRFNQKIKFDYLKDNAKESLFNLMLGELMEGKLNENELSQLHQTKNLTPGDFKVVYQKNFFLGKCENRKLIEDLQNEVSYKLDVKKRISL